MKCKKCLENFDVKIWFDHSGDLGAHTMILLTMPWDKWHMQSVGCSQLWAGTGSRCCKWHMQSVGCSQLWAGTRVALL